jgi:hypothetical protein
MSLSSPLTLAIVKNELGITPATTTYDAQITERIPFAEAKFRKVANYQFRKVIQVWYDSGSAILKVYQDANSDVDFLDYGDIILSADFADGTYVIENYRVPNPTWDDDPGIFYELKLSSNATADSSTGGSDMVICYNISHYAVLSQIVWYMISEQDITKVGESSVTSKRVGPLSVTYGPGDINQRFGLPNKIVQQIPKYQGFY